MQNMYIIIVFVFCVNAMAISVIVNQAEYQWRCFNSFKKRLSQKSEKTAVLCMELFKKKRGKVIESPSSY